MITPTGFTTEEYSELQDRILNKTMSTSEIQQYVNRILSLHEDDHTRNVALFSLVTLCSLQLPSSGVDMKSFRERSKEYIAFVQEVCNTVIIISRPTQK
jgi:hypothetical protein